jgi:hypothetical protein
MSGGHSMATTKGKTHKRTHDAMTANNMSTQH